MKKYTLEKRRYNPGLQIFMYVWFFFLFCFVVYTMHTAPVVLFSCFVINFVILFDWAYKLKEIK